MKSLINYKFREKSKMKKGLVYVVFSMLAFLYGSPELKATPTGNALNPLQNSKGLENGTLFAQCTIDVVQEANMFNGIKKENSNY